MTSEGITEFGRPWLHAFLRDASTKVKSNCVLAPSEGVGNFCDLILRHNSPSIKRVCVVGPGKAVSYDYQGIRRSRFDKHSAGTYFMIRNNLAPPLFLHDVLIAPRSSQISSAACSHSR